MKTKRCLPLHSQLPEVHSLLTSADDAELTLSNGTLLDSPAALTRRRSEDALTADEALVDTASIDEL